MSYLSGEELRAGGFGSVGHGVLVSRMASFYGTHLIELGDRVRIDDFCVISAGSGGVRIGRHVHIAPMCTLIGAGSIIVGDFSNLSGRVSVYSSSDDFSGEWMAGATLPAELRNVSTASVEIGRHAVVGAGTVILPGSVIGEGSAVGALSLVKGQVLPNSIYAGIPATCIAPRSARCVSLESKLDSTR